MHTRYIDPKVDFGFKRIFGNADVLVAFLNVILPTADRIARIEYLNTVVVGDSPASRMIIYDLRCRTEDGRTIIVEFQRLPQPYFKERSLFYAMRGFEDQVQRGDQTYELTPVYLVAIVDYKLPGDYEGYVHHFTLKNEQGELFSPILQLFFLELPKLPMIDEQTTLSPLEQWMEAIRHMPAMERIPDWVTDEDLKKAFEIAEVAAMSPEERERYERAFREDIDLRGAVLQQYIWGKQEGREEGREETILQALRNGLHPEEAAKIFNISMVEIKRLVS